MLGIIGLILLVLIACFGFVLVFGPPYLPTLTKHMKVALDLADLQPGQTLLELGCGDGKVLVAAAARGWNAVGYELNPLLVIFCKLRCWRYRKQVTVRWANFWTRPWPKAEAIFVFILPKHMLKLDKKIVQYVEDVVNSSSNSSRQQAERVRLVSFAFAIPGKAPVAQQDGVFVYDYQLA